MGILRHPYPVVMLALLLGAGWTWANRLPEGGLQAQVDVAPRTDFAAPPLTLNDLSGLPVDLGRFKGQVVVLNFWAAWCPPCRAEMPELDRVYRAHQNAGLAVLAVNEQEDAATVKTFGDQLRLSFPLLLDPDGEAGRRYQVRALPTTFFIDRRGVIRAVSTGPLARPVLEDKLRALLVED